MAKIKSIKGRQVFDSRGNPTVEAEIFLENGMSATAIVPSGASTGSHEAFELRDKSITKFLGKSVFKAVENINTKISKALKGMECSDQKKIDDTLINLDGTKQKKKLGANSILASSISSCKLAAKENNIPLYKYLGGQEANQLPVPLMNVINGGAHANNLLRIQEFMIRPEKSKSFSEAMETCFLVIQKLKYELSKKHFSLALGDEGGFAPDLAFNDEAIRLINLAIKKAGFKPGEDVSICLDVASNELYKNGRYSIKDHKYLTFYDTHMYYRSLIKKYSIKSIEDPFEENAWSSWTTFTKNHDIQIVGDDLFATNNDRLMIGIKSRAANAILIKPNQIGTVTETLKVIETAKNNNFRTIISHRSGDSEDTFISDLAVATNSSQIKTGSLARSERVAKYNRLLRVEEELGNQAKMAKI